MAIAYLYLATADGTLGSNGRVNKCEGKDLLNPGNIAISCGAGNLLGEDHECK